MPKKMTITIEVEGGNPQATIRCNDAVYVVDGLALFADSDIEGNLFSFWWNRPGPAARAVVRSCAAAINQADEWATQFYRAMLRGFCQCTQETRQNEVTAEEVLARWEKENKTERRKRLGLKLADTFVDEKETVH